MQAKHTGGNADVNYHGCQSSAAGPPIKRYLAAKRGLRFLGRSYGESCEAEARLSVISRRNVICVFTAQRGLSRAPTLKPSHQSVPDCR